MPSDTSLQHGLALQMQGLYCCRSSQFVNLMELLAKEAGPSVEHVHAEALSRFGVPCVSQQHWQQVGYSPHDI